MPRKQVSKPREVDPYPDDGIMVTDGADHPSLPDPQPDGGRGEKWNYPPTSKRCTAASKQRTKAAREAGLIGPTETRRCRRPCTAGFDKCRYHKGQVPGQWNSKLPSNGRYSKASGVGRLRQAYEDSLGDSDLLSLREPIAMLDAVAKRRIERVEELDTPYFRQEALRLYLEHREAEAEGKDADADQILHHLGDLLEMGGREDQALSLVTETVEILQRRVEEAWKIKLKAEEVINVRDLVAVLGRLSDIVVECSARAREHMEGLWEPVADAIAQGGPMPKKALKRFQAALETKLEDEILQRFDQLIRGFGSAHDRKRKPPEPEPETVDAEFVEVEKDGAA